MSEQNNQNFEKQESKEEINVAQAKPIPKMALIIGAVAVAVIAIVVVIIALVGGNKNGTSNPDETPAHTHEYGEWETTKPSTCDATGTKERYCSCGEKLTSDIPMEEHTYGEWSTITESTCNQYGVKKRVCLVCNYEDIGKLDLSNTHTYGEWSVKKPSTCDSTGTKIRVCTLCGKEETGVIYKIDHDVNSSTGKCINCNAQIAAPQIELTTENIYDYLYFVAASENVIITDKSSMTVHNESGDGSVRVTATKLQNVTFHNVELVISLETSSTGWGTMYNREIIIPFDGAISTLYSIHAFANKVSPTPTYRVVVQSVTGYVTINS